MAGLFGLAGRNGHETWRGAGAKSSVAFPGRPSEAMTPTMTRPRFHLAFPVHDLAEARAFYGGLLGCPEGRSAADWIDFDFHGHQIVAHLAAPENTPGADRASTNLVDGEAVPVRHFGVILEPGAWQALAERLIGAGTRFLIEPQTRFAGQPGEQRTMFFLYPSGNALEFKAFADDAQVFAKDVFA